MNMTDKLLEQVSVLADDELNAGEAELLLARMERDPALRDAWERYFLVGEAMRGSLPEARFRDLASGVAEAIAGDAVSAPSPVHGLREFLRPVAGFAVAASVAVIAVFTLREPVNLPGEVVPRGGDAPVAAPLMSSQAVGFSGVRSPELQNQLRTYLLNHSEHSGSPRIRGVMPYVQLAAHDSRPVKVASETTRENDDPDSRD